MKCKLSDIVLINPSEKLRKGTLAKKVSMDKLQPYCRDIPDFSYEEFTGGSKFRNGDTLMARITPCLENGKIAKVSILENEEIGFGSTEFIVFRAIDGVSDPDFIYYLIISKFVREPAIKSMVGSSGRQRVQTDVVANLELNIPDLETQKRIAKILSSLDDKIECNNQINKNLEDQVNALFSIMFGYFIDNLNNSSVRLGEIVESIDNRGKTPPLSDIPTEYPIIDVKALSGSSRIINYDNCTKYVTQETYNQWFRNGHPQEYDILISTVGSLAEVKLFLGNIGCIAQNVVGFRSKNISPLYL